MSLTGIQIQSFHVVVSAAQAGAERAVTIDLLIKVQICEVLVAFAVVIELTSQQIPIA